MASLNTSLSSNPPTNYMIVLFPGFQLLDATGPLDLLRSIILGPRAANITLTTVAETKEAVSTAPVPPASQENDWEMQGMHEIPLDKGTNKMVRGFNPRLDVDATFEQVLADPAQWPVDVLLIPGGFGTRMQRLSKATGEVVPGGNAGPSKHFVTSIAPRVGAAILTVCTGSDLLAQTGLLDGRRATTNMRAFDMVAARPSNQNVQWVRGARWVRAQVPGSIDIWTSAGISAGMDLTLAFLSEVYDVDFARALARRLEYDWKELKEGEVDPMYVREGMMQNS